MGISNIFAQNENLQVGGTINRIVSPQGGFFDYSEPSAMNIKVDVWGFVKYPGKFIIPSYSKVNDLLSYAGGPIDESHLDEMKIIRTLPDSSQRIIQLNYKDVLFDNESKEMKTIYLLEPGDILVVPGSPRFYLKDYLTTAISLVSVLISVLILVRQK